MWNISHSAGVSATGVDDARRHVLGVRRDEAHPLEAGGRADVAEEVGELLRAAWRSEPPRVDVLAEQRHLLVPVRHELLDLLRIASRGRLCSAPRVVGTTQYVQRSLQP